MNYKKRISKHISYEEATKSRTATKHNIDNAPSEEEISNMKYIAENIFEVVRGHLKCPIAVTSFFRSKALNKKLKGSKSSQHVTGQAMDLDADVYGITTNKAIFDYIKNNLEFDQLIWEYGDGINPDWVHVSLKECGINRKECLQAYKKKLWYGTVTQYRYI